MIAPRSRDVPLADIELGGTGTSPISPVSLVEPVAGDRDTVPAGLGFGGLYEAIRVPGEGDFSGLLNATFGFDFFSAATGDGSDRATRGIPLIFRSATGFVGAILVRTRVPYSSRNE